jgi:uncharacterized protein YecT (DUF1311 family)
MRGCALLFVCAAIVACAIAPARADTEDDPYSPLLVQCVADAQGGAGVLRACKDKAAAPCIEQDGSTNGMVLCIGNETAIWENLIDAHLERLAAASPASAESLTSAQQAWLAYREAQCGYRVALWGEGSEARVEHASCFQEMAVERAVSLASIEP